jgi:hypothetical protein
MSDIATYRMDAYDARMQALAIDIRLEMGNIRNDLRALPSKAALWGMIGTTIAIAAALIAVFVGVLTYLHPPH